MTDMESCYEQIHAEAVDMAVDMLMGWVVERGGDSAVGKLIDALVSRASRASVYEAEVCVVAAQLLSHSSPSQYRRFDLGLLEDEYGRRLDADRGFDADDADRDFDVTDV